mgnify:CR=1 FL=1
MTSEAKEKIKKFINQEKNSNATLNISRKTFYRYNKKICHQKSKKKEIY